MFELFYLCCYIINFVSLQYYPSADTNDYLYYDLSSSHLSKLFVRSTKVPLQNLRTCLYDVSSNNSDRLGHLRTDWSRQRSRYRAWNRSTLSEGCFIYKSAPHSRWPSSSDWTSALSLRIWPLSRLATVRERIVTMFAAGGGQPFCDGPLI